MSDIATTTDAKLMTGPAFVRTAPLAPLPPPLTEAGAIGWARTKAGPAISLASVVVAISLMLLPGA